MEERRNWHYPAARRKGINATLLHGPRLSIFRATVREKQLHDVTSEQHQGESRGQIGALSPSETADSKLHPSLTRTRIYCWKIRIGLVLSGPSFQTVYQNTSRFDFLIMGRKGSDDQSSIRARTDPRLQGRQRRDTEPLTRGPLWRTTTDVPSNRKPTHPASFPACCHPFVNPPPPHHHHHPLRGIINCTNWISHTNYSRIHRSILNTQGLSLNLAWFVAKQKNINVISGWKIGPG